MSRLLQHLLHTPLATRRAFPAATQEAIRRAVQEGEHLHRGEIRFVVEGDWPLSAVLAGKTVHERALEVFGLTRVWDTAENTGLLVYVLLCERHAEILADRGLHAAVAPGTWKSVCDEMLADFRDGKFEAGSVRAVQRISAELARHFPAGADNPDELPDAPLVWR